MADKLFTDLQAQIESIHNPLDFERLVDDIFSRIHGTKYSPSDSHGDRGMDGYISSSKTLIAKHCFEKLVLLNTNKSKEILKKARSDLKKAAKLSKKIDINRWMFITPYKVPVNVFLTLKNETKEDGFELDCPGPSFIAGVLIKNKDILQNHSYLHVIRIDEALQHIENSLKEIVTTDQAKRVVEESSKVEGENVRKIEEPKLPQDAFMTIPKKENSKDFKRLLEIYKSPPSAELEKEVKSIIYSSKDQGAVLQGIHLLVSWYKFSISTVDDFMVFINLGIDAARGLKSLGSEAVLLAEKASLLSTKFVLMDLEGWGNIQMSKITGFLLITDEKRAAIVTELKRLNGEFNELFKDALQKAYGSNSYLAVTRTFSIAGSSAGSRAGHFFSLGIRERAILEKGICKAAFMYAKSVAAQFKDGREMAYILYNFANALGFADEADEALLVLKEAVNIAKKYKMNDILGNIGRLGKLIREPKIRLVNNKRA